MHEMSPAGAIRRGFFFAEASGTRSTRSRYGLMIHDRTLEALKGKNNHLSLVSRLKGSGYLTSMISVFLLAIPGLKSATEKPALLICLILGMLTSIGGMYLRWRSHRLEQKEK